MKASYEINERNHDAFQDLQSSICCCDVSRLPASILNRLSQQFQEFINSDSTPHGLPAIVHLRSPDWSLSYCMHLLRASAVGVHTSLLCSGVHCFHLSLCHHRIARHEVNALKYSDSTPLQALELDCLGVFLCEIQQTKKFRRQSLPAPESTARNKSRTYRFSDPFAHPQYS